MDDLSFIREVAHRLKCDESRAEAAVFVIFRELRDRLTPREATHVAAQLPHRLKQFWTDDERPDREVRKTHRAEFVGRVRQRTAVPDDGEAERLIKAVFGTLQKLLGSRAPTEGESWDIFSQLPKDMKTLWLAAGETSESK